MVDTKARKGDVVLVKRSHSSYTIGSYDSHDSESYELGTVRKATREGMVDEVDTFGGGIVRRRDSSWRSVYVIGEVSAADAEKVARDHHWPGHPGQVMPFDSIDDVKSALRPFRR